MQPSKSEQDSMSIPSLRSFDLQGGGEIRIEPRLVCLAAALTAPSLPTASEHPLVTTTREYVKQFATHPSIRWLSEQAENVWLLGLAMRTVQLGKAPRFLPCPPDEIPLFVQKDFPEPPLETLGHHLALSWNDADMPTLLASQATAWRGVCEDVKSVLGSVDIVAFEELFFGSYSSHLVVVPLANLVPSWVNGVGVANRCETYAVCCLKSAQSFHANPLRLLDLAQHEASHPVVEDILKDAPDVPDACAFLEKTSPPSGRFAQIYEDHDSRWAEVLIRASTWFFLREIGRDDDAKAHLQGQRDQGVATIDAYIAALEPWWRERRAGRAPGLDAVLEELPSWLQR